jgi:hypothetical protein
MKKLLLILTVVAVLAMGASAAFAQSETGSNMDADTYIAIRTEQLDDAITEGVIDQGQYDLLLAHITEQANAGDFGIGESEACILGEDGYLGIFKNAGGLGTGQGNGGEAKGNGQGEASGNGNRGSNGQGLRVQDGTGENEDCILD